MELVELVRGAQEALDRGDYHLASKACGHALEAYPSCFSAHRILGESLLERGETEAAMEHFDKTLACDPLNVVARLGLGVAAEERKNLGLAYAQYLHAWEINPALDQVRHHIVRLRAALGSQDRLHPTRAGLAGIHARGGQLGRAAAEWRAILSADPDSSRAQTSLAEVIWRAGDDASAAALCRDVLRQSPVNARALALLAEIEKRQGSLNTGDLTERYRAIDPLGEIAKLLKDLREGANFDFLPLPAAEAPDFDFNTAAANQPPEAVGLSASPLLAASHVAAPDLWDSIVRDMQPGTEGADGGIEIQPFSWTDDGVAVEGDSSSEPFSLDGLQDIDEPALSTAAPNAASSASAAPAGVAMTDELILEALSEIPVATAPGEPTPPLPAANPFVSADGRVDLTIGWDDLDRALKAATPGDDAGNGYEALLAELDAGGMAPFAADDAGSLGAWEPFSVDEFGDNGAAAGQAVQPQPPMVDPADEVVSIVPSGAAMAPEDRQDWSTEEAAVPADWVDIDEDLIAAIPSQQPSGYTDLLRHIDNEAVQEFEEIVAEAVDPFANPDAAGNPLDVEELLNVTSSDSTGPLVAAADPGLLGPDAAIEAFSWSDEDFASPDPLAAFAAAGANDLDAMLGAVEPFNFDDLTAAHGDHDFVGDDLADLGLAADGRGLDQNGADDVDWASFTDEPEAPLAVAPPMVDRPVVEVPAASLPPIRRDIIWPTVVADSSDSFYGADGSGGLFARLRGEKQMLVEGGLIEVDRSLLGRVTVISADRHDEEPEVDSVAAHWPVFAAAGANGVTNGPSNGWANAEGQDGDLDLAAMRAQLIESEDAATKVAKTLEAAIARGYPDSLALRVLGEAYLRMGRTEQAAAQFREAMMARRRVR